VPAKHGAPLMISGSILTTDRLTPLNVGQGENYCNNFDGRKQVRLIYKHSSPFFPEYQIRIS